MSSWKLATLIICVEFLKLDGLELIICLEFLKLDGSVLEGLVSDADLMISSDNMVTLDGVVGARHLLRLRLNLEKLKL